MNPSGQRIDKWLFFARVVKSRSLAAKLAQSGRVRVNRDKIDQASHVVKPGDVLTVTLDRHIRVLKVVACGERRGPFSEAQTLFEDMTPPASSGGEHLASALPPLREPGSGRPTKRERRLLDRISGVDEGED
jgi:ribosome-associated heat shock protein Hsp15